MVTDSVLILYIRFERPPAPFLDLDLRCITPLDIQNFHKRYNTEISSKDVRKIIHEIDTTNKGKIFLEDFYNFLSTEL